MTGKITRIDPEKPSGSSRSKTFIRVYFELKAGDEESQWAKTDLDPKFRNFKRWKHLLKEGVVLAGLTMKNAVTVDADSIPRIAKEEDLTPTTDTPPAPAKQTGRAYVIVQHTDGIYLCIDNPDTPSENDTYCRDRREAHKFYGDTKAAAADKARAAIKRFSLDPAFYRMKSPKDK